MLNQGTLTFLLLLACFQLYGQTRILTGFVFDKDGEAIEYATISTIPATQDYAYTNAYGYFSIEIDNVVDSILVQYVGFVRVSIAVHSIDSSQPIKISLPQYSFKEIVVSATSITDHLNRSSVDIARLKSLPFLLGEADPMKAFLRFPGVQGGLEGSASLHVRGGSPDQNLLLLDEAVVYNANHVFGFLSIFNGNVIKSADLFKGGFNAKYGGRLSSVIDVRTREGSRDTTKQKLGLGLVSSDYVREGPLFSKRSSYLISIRAASILPLTFVQRGLYIAGQSTDLITYGMYDGNVKLNFDINKSDKLYLSLYFSNDRMLGRYREFTGAKDEEKNLFKWGNLSLSTRYTHPMGKKTFFNGILYRTNYNFNLSFQSIDSGEGTEFSNNFIQTNKIEDLGSRFYFATQLNSWFSLNYGSDFSLYNNTPTSQVSYVNEGGIRDTFYQRSTSSDGYSIAAYIHNRIVKGVLTLELGGRVSLYHSIKTASNHLSFEPRVNAGIKFTPNLGVVFTYDKMFQAVQSLNSTGSGLPYETWVLSDKNILPSNSHNYSAGLSYRFWNGKASTSLNYYYRRFTNLSELTGRGFFILPPESEFDQFVASEGKGRAWGFEFMIDLKVRKSRFEISYTYGKSWRWFSEIDAGQTFPYKFDRRHAFLASLDLALYRNWKLNITWEFQTGPPVDLPTSRSVNQFGEISYIYGRKNAYRLPDYHRMDIAFYHTKIKGNKTHEWSLGVYNVYNQRNPYFLRLNKHIIQDENNNVIGLLPYVQQVSLFRFLPFVKYTMTF